MFTGKKNITKKSFLYLILFQVSFFLSYLSDVCWSELVGGWFNHTANSSIKHDLLQEMPHISLDNDWMSIENSKEIQKKYIQRKYSINKHVRQLISTPTIINKLTMKYLLIDLPFFTLNMNR